MNDICNSSDATDKILPSLPILCLTAVTVFVHQSQIWNHCTDSPIDIWYVLVLKQTKLQYEPFKFWSEIANSANKEAVPVIYCMTFISNSETLKFNQMDFDLTESSRDHRLIKNTEMTNFLKFEAIFFKRYHMTISCTPLPGHKKTLHWMTNSWDHLLTTKGPHHLPGLKFDQVLFLKTSGLQVSFRSPFTISISSCLLKFKDTIFSSRNATYVRRLKLTSYLETWCSKYKLTVLGLLWNQKVYL